MDLISFFEEMVRRSRKIGRGCSGANPIGGWHFLYTAGATTGAIDLFLDAKLSNFQLAGTTGRDSNVFGRFQFQSERWNCHKSNTEGAQSATTTNFGQTLWSNRPVAATSKVDCSRCNGCIFHATKSWKFVGWVPNQMVDVFRGFVGYAAKWWHVAPRLWCGYSHLATRCSWNVISQVPSCTGCSGAGVVSYAYLFPVPLLLLVSEKLRGFMF